MRCSLGILCLLWCARSLLFAAPAQEQKLMVTGSSTVAPILLELAKMYEKQHAGVRIDVQSGGSSRGVADAKQGLADFGMISRDLKPEDSPLEGFPIARDGIAIIVHKSNPLRAIQGATVKQIFQGKIRSWKELQGADKPIVVITKAEGRSTLELFLAYFGLKNSEIKASAVIGDNEQGIKMVMGNPQAIAYVSIGTAESQAANGAPIKLLSLDGVPASIAEVTGGRYPLSRTLNLVAPKPVTKSLARNFLDFVRSQEAEPVIKELHFVPIVVPR